MKTLLVTGASRGLGLQITEQFLAEGNHVIALARNLSERLKELQSQFPNELLFCATDLSQPAQIKNQQPFTQIGLQTPIHGLVNNAGIAYDDLVTNCDQEPLEQMFRVNVFSVMELTKLTVRNMLLHKVAGSIVHISSISAHTGYKGLAMYAASKGAVEAFSKNTAREWGSKRIRSNCVVAGFMETEMSRTLSDEQKKRIYQRTALKQATSIDSVVGAVRFLLSDASASITGQNLFVDSGTT